MRHIELKTPDQPLYEIFFARVSDMAEANLEQPDNPAWFRQMSCMPGSGIIWQWDSCFMALFSDFLNGESNGFHNLDNLYSCQREDGYIAMAYRTKTGKPEWDGRINPPLYAYVELEHFRRTGDASRLPRIYPVLKKYFFWIENNRKRKNGLYYFEDPGSSGMDNSPRGTYPDVQLTGGGVCFVDLACQQRLAALNLAEIAELLRQSDEAKIFRDTATRIGEKIQAFHWCESQKFFYDTFDGSNNFLAARTIAAFWAMLSQSATPEQCDALVAALLDPEDFNTPCVVPGLSRRDPNYAGSGKYWCGGVWAPAVYMIVKGLRRIGRKDVAHSIAVRHLEQIIATYQIFSPHSIWECYSPESAAPADNKAGKTVRHNFVGWSGLAPTALLIEEILGINLNVPRASIEWDLNCRCSVKNMPFMDDAIDLEYDGAKLKIKSSRKLSITVFKNQRKQDFVAIPGAKEYDVVI